MNYSFKKIMLWVGGLTLLMGVIAVVVINSLGLRYDPKNNCNADLITLFIQVLEFEKDNGFLPDTAQGLSALVERPISHPHPERWRNLLRSIPNDPWGHSYILESPVSGTPHGFQIRSLGPNINDPADDIVLSEIGPIKAAGK